MCWWLASSWKPFRCITCFHPYFLPGVSNLEVPAFLSCKISPCWMLPTYFTYREQNCCSIWLPFNWYCVTENKCFCFTSVFVTDWPYFFSQTILTISDHIPHSQTYCYNFAFEKLTINNKVALYFKKELIS